MPRGSWRWVVVVGVLWGAAGGTAGATPPVAPLAPTPPAGGPPAAAAPLKLLAPVAAVPPSALPTLAPDAEPPVKDLTPPGFDIDSHGPGDHGGHGEVPGHLNPSAPEEGGPFGSAEFLLLRPRRGAFDFYIPSTAGGLSTTGPVQSLNYELRTGLRADLGYRLGHSGWDVLAEYTYFRSNAFDARFAGPGQVLLPTLTRPGLTENVAFAGADANLEYNLYDAQVGRRFTLDDHLALRLYGGLRFANIRQDFNGFYDGIDARAANVNVKSNFQGFGPILGGEAVWAGWRGFHLYARGSGGLITGQSNNPISETNNAGQTLYVNSAYDVRKVVPMTSIGVGGGWQYRTVTIRAGYEITHWFGLIDQPRFVDDVGQGKFVTRPANLSLEGLFLRFGLAF